MKYFLTIFTYLRIKHFESLVNILNHFHLTVQFNLITYTLSLQERFEKNPITLTNFHLVLTFI